MSVDFRSCKSYESLNRHFNEHYAFAYTSTVFFNDGIMFQVQEKMFNFVQKLMPEPVIDMMFVLTGSVAEGVAAYSVDNPSMDYDFMIVPTKFSIREHEQREVLQPVPGIPWQVWVKILDPDGLRSLVSEDIHENEQLFQVRQKSSGEKEYFLISNTGGKERSFVPLCSMWSVLQNSSNARVNLNALISSPRSPLTGLSGNIGQSRGPRLGPASTVGITTGQIQIRSESMVRCVEKLEQHIYSEVNHSDSDNDVFIPIFNFVFDNLMSASKDKIADEVEWLTTDDFQGKWYGKAKQRIHNNPAEGETTIDLREEGSQTDELTEEENIPFEAIQTVLNTTCDCVPAIFCEGWPYAATEWKNRKRVWPGAEVIHRVTKGGFHLVSKTTTARQSKVDLEWRLSFSKAEIVLFHQINKFQKKCYIIFKTIFANELSFPKAICSYHVKTIFLWACERIPSEMWVESNLAQIIMGLLDDLLHCLVTKNCPHYFIPENNLFADIHEDFLARLARILSEIRTNPMKCPTFVFKYGKAKSTERPEQQEFREKKWNDSNNQGNGIPLD